MKISLITSLLFLFLVPGNAFCQLTYMGSPAQKVSTATNALLRLKQDTIYVPTQDGLFKKSILSDDTLWIQAGFQGMKINDFALIGQDSIVCVVDSTEGNTVFISLNNGVSFANSTHGFGGTGLDFLPGYRVDVNPDNHQEIIAMSGACVARSTDFGGSWTPIHLTWGYSNLQFTLLQYHPLNSTLIYSGGERAIFDSYLAYSFDSGTSWTNSAVESNNAVNGIAFHPTQADTIFIGMEGKIARSADKGVTWSDVYLTPHYEYIYAIVYDESNSNSLYAAGAINGTNDTVRIFRSLDGGSNWAEWVKAIFPGGEKNVISMRMYNGVLCLLTRDSYGNLQGIYKLDATTVSIPEINNVPMRVFPNPFASETTLQTDHPFKDATLTLENCLGQTVKQMTNISGQSVTISRDNLPGGLYFMRLTAANINYTYKVIITDK